MQDNTFEPVRDAVETAMRVGMHQHRAEIEPFAQWLYARKPRNVIEIGTLHGGTATLWHALCSGAVVSIDLPEGRFGGADHQLNLRRCIERTRRLERSLPRFRAVIGDSHREETYELTRLALLGERADMLFIDGDHTYEGVKQDFETYRQLVTHDGIVVFHDILTTDVHTAAGCEVDRLWKELRGRKVVFSINGPWGGIGVLHQR